MLTNLKIIYTLFLLTNIYFPLCSEGCLRCSKDDVCEICDVNLGFVRDEANCKHQKIPNCLLSYEKNKCSHCDIDFFLNPANNLCSPVDDKVPFCNFYIDARVCKECEQNYYIKDGLCIKVKTEINDCAEYIGDGKCKRCFEKVLSLDQTKCEKTNREMDFNCAYRFFPQMCHKCKSGYEMKRKVVHVDLENINKDFAILRKMKFKSRLNYKNYPYCFKSDTEYVSNPECSDKNFLKADCFKCDSGKYFDKKTGNCVTNPKALTLTTLIIPHCSFINPDSIICEKCFEGFFINYSKKKCLPHSKNIDGCVVMSQKIDGECYLCKEGFFLENSQLCKSRTFLDDNCEHYSYFIDACVECKTNFLLINNDEKCIAKIPNCQDYTTGINSITCLKCSQNFYLSSNTCLAVPSNKIKSDCLAYNTDIECIECKLSHILLHDTTNNNEFSCPLISSNIIYKLCNQAIKDQNGIRCHICADNGIKLKHYNKCEVDSVYNDKNCEKYIENGVNITCTQCQDGYFLNTTSGNCKEGSGDCRLYANSNDDIRPQCLICEELFFLVDGNCIKEKDNGECEQLNAESNCIVCNKNKKSTSTIVEIEYEECRSKMFYSSFTDCQKIKRVSDYLNVHTEQCIRCPEGTYPDKDNNSTCHNCSDNKCTFYIASDNKLKVAYDESHCLIKDVTSNVCLQFRDSIQYYITTPTPTTKEGYRIFRNKLIPKITQYPPKSYKTNYSKYYKNIFFVNTTNAANNIIYGATCINGIARTFEKTTLEPIEHDCLVYIKNCNVDSNKYIGSENRIYASCNKCYENLAVHYTKLAISITTDVNTYFPNLSNNFSKSNQGTNLPSTFCYPPSTGTGSVDNCALFEVTNAPSIKRICKDCKPGYKLVGESCTVIDNCDKSKITGRCEKCKKSKTSGQNYVLKSLYECVIATPNCSEVNITDNSCKKCIDGYKLSSNGSSCIKINFYNCKKFEGDQCVQCRDPMEIVYNYTRKEINGLITCQPGASSKPDNCRLVDFKGFCVLCDTDYFVDLGGKCFPKKKVPNCKLFNGINGHCFECRDGFIYNEIQKKCISPDNKDYDTNCTGDYPYPFKTNKGMTNSCGNIQIENCTFLDYSLLDSQKLGCMKCKIGFKLENENVLENCLTLEKLPNCKSHLTDKELNYSCIECENGYYLDHAHICRKRFNVPECEEYYKNSKYCKRCSSEYYANNEECLKRTRIFDYCIEYYLNSDDCRKFKSDYQYFYDIRDLVLNPPSVESSDIANAILTEYNGILGCEEYYDFTTCKICGSNTYLKNNLCFPTNDIIPFCLFYKANSVCQECNTGYLLLNNECKIIKAQNCLVYTDETKCKTCPREFPVLTTNFNCSKNVQVKFCEEHKTASSCSKCISGYYLKGETDHCFLVDKKIEKCLDYNPSQNCIKCETGYYVWENNCFINPDYDTNCEYFNDTKYNCSLCYEGYVLIDNYCFKCGHIFENCAVCDETNNEQCLMCKSGFYMDKEGKCNKNENYHSFIPFFKIGVE